MKLKYCFIAIVIVMVATPALAAEYKTFGIGVIAGEPTGITGKYMLNDTNGIDAGVGWKTSGDSEFHIYADYLFHIHDLIKVKKGALPVYVGGGLRWVDRDKKDNKFGFRIPVGLEYLFDNVALGAFAELVPVLNLTPDTDFDLEGGVGIRFYF
jgi:hypothetical protein